MNQAVLVKIDRDVRAIFSRWSLDRSTIDAAGETLFHRWVRSDDVIDVTVSGNGVVDVTVLFGDSDVIGDHHFNGWSNDVAALLDRLARHGA